MNTVHPNRRMRMFSYFCLCVGFVAGMFCGLIA